MSNASVQLSFVSSQDFIDALEEEFVAQKLVLETKKFSGSKQEREKYAFDLATIADLVTLFMAGVTLAQISYSIIKARERSKAPFIEVKTPRGQIRVPLENATQSELIEALTAIKPLFED